MLLRIRWSSEGGQGRNKAFRHWWCRQPSVRHKTVAAAPQPQKSAQTCKLVPRRISPHAYNTHTHTHTTQYNTPHPPTRPPTHTHTVSHTQKRTHVRTHARKRARAHTHGTSFVKRDAQQCWQRQERWWPVKTLPSIGYFAIGDSNHGQYERVQTGHTVFAATPPRSLKGNVIENAGKCDALATVSGQS